MYEEEETPSEATTEEAPAEEAPPEETAASPEDRIQKVLEWIEQTRRDCPSERFQRRPCTRCQALREVAKKLQG